MTYDHWKTTPPDWDDPTCDECGAGLLLDPHTDRWYCERCEEREIMQQRMMMEAWRRSRCVLLYPSERFGFTEGEPHMQTHSLKERFYIDEQKLCCIEINPEPRDLIRFFQALWPTVSQERFVGATPGYGGIFPIIVTHDKAIVVDLPGLATRLAEIMSQLHKRFFLPSIVEIEELDAKAARKLWLKVTLLGDL